MTETYVYAVVMVCNVGGTNWHRRQIHMWLHACACSMLTWMRDYEVGLFRCGNEVEMYAIGVLCNMFLWILSYRM